MGVGFRPTEADDRIIQAHKRSGETTSDVMRRALRALEREEWQAQARRDMERIAASGEDLSEEADEWGYDDEGKVVDLRPVTRSAASPSTPEPTPAPSGQVPVGRLTYEAMGAVRRANAEMMAPLRQHAAVISKTMRSAAFTEAARNANLAGALAARSNLAFSYQKVGRIDEAIALLERVVADNDRLLGSDHTYTLTARANLAASYKEAGRTDQAIAIEEQVLTDQERLLGDEHPSTVATRTKLADSYQRAGRTGEAIALLERVVADQHRFLGDSDTGALLVTHPGGGTAVVAHDLASGLGSLMAAAQDAVGQSVDSLHSDWEHIGLRKFTAHGDLRPANVLLRPAGSAVLIDSDSRLSHVAPRHPMRHWKINHLRSLAARRAGKR
ncbi:tetratricopeptide repeat protein [Streptomyces sp. Ag109_O5-1]|uniref:tetratricopeptide repeat protein n=1 Tax=Streptomyces sp. Ag109_O5-1 TaxID=1938851 RepID=UPI000FBCE57F|nr:tetratricopeptide repeat protein [Streptomyces sp. Ag109_O5-1]RPE38996.1 tetratricopeptide repeat protein [Streptomyces sp. Ag109_O5-1]